MKNGFFRRKNKKSGILRDVFFCEKIGNPDFPAAFSENSENSGHSSKIRPSFPEILIPKAEKSGFRKIFFFIIQLLLKNHFFCGFSVLPSFRPFFPCENFSDFFLVPVCSFSRKFIFSSVFSFFPEISFSENIKIQRMKRQTVNFSDCRNPKDLLLSKGFFLFFFLLYLRPLFQYFPAVR